VSIWCGFGYGAALDTVRKSIESQDVVDVLHRWIAPAVRGWQEYGGAHVIVRTATAPVRRILSRVTVENSDNLPAVGPVIVAANHLSFFDSVLLMFSLPRPVSMLGKAEYADNPVTKWLYCGSGMIPIRRENPADMGQAFEQVEAVLDRAGVVGVFPEGTRSRDGLLHRGRSGAAHLALTTDVPIVPVGLIGTDKLLPTGSGIVRPFQRININVGKPIVAADLGFTTSTKRARREITDKLMSQIQTLCGQEYVDEYAPLSTNS